MKVICFDRDGVVVKRGTWWDRGEIKTYEIEDRVKEKIAKLCKGYFVCVTSGRSIEFLESEWKDLMGEKFAVHGEIGNLIKYDGGLWEEEWSEEETRLLENIRQQWSMLRDGRINGFEPKRKIVTMHCSRRVEEAEKMVTDERLYCWWNEEAYDVGLKRITKLTGIKKWAEMLGIDLSEVIMVGHGINDQGAMGGVGKTISVAENEEIGGERTMDELLELIK